MKHKYLGSSINPEQISLTVKSIIGFIVLILVNFGFNITTAEGNELSQVIQSTITAIWGAVNSALLLWGIIRKIAVKLNIIKPKG